MSVRKRAEAGPSTGSSPGPIRWAGAAPPRRRAHRAPQTPHVTRRPGGQVHLPVLRGRLRTAGLRQGRAGRADRGRPRLARQPRAAVPQGLRHAPAHHRRRPPPPGPLPPPPRHRLGAARPGHGHGHGGRARDPAPGARPGSGRTTGCAWHAPWASPAWAAPRSTTRRTTSSRSCFTGLGVVQVENQARVCHSSTVAGLGTSFGRGGATTFMQDLQHADCIVIQGSNFAEAHPVGFQWVMEAKARGATIIHVDPRFTRTSALADLHVPIRAGTDIAFLGGLIHHVLSEEKDFREYVLAYTNAATLVGEDFRDTEDLDGVFSGLDPDSAAYDPTSWQYEGASVHGRPTAVDARTPAATRRRARRPRRGGRAVQAAAGSEAAGPAVTRSTAHPSATRRSSTRAASTRSSSGTTPATPPRWSSGSAASRGTPSSAVCDALTANSGRDRTSAFCYAVGWTQHTVGSQYIRTASDPPAAAGQHRPARRRHPGAARPRLHPGFQRHPHPLQPAARLPPDAARPRPRRPRRLRRRHQDRQGLLGQHARAYTVSLLKAYYGDAATAENDFCFDHLPRLTGSHGTYDTVLRAARRGCARATS